MNEKTQGLAKKTAQPKGERLSRQAAALKENLLRRKQAAAKNDPGKPG